MASVKPFLVFVQVKISVYEKEKYEICWSLQSLPMFKNAIIFPHAKSERNLHCIVEESDAFEIGKKIYLSIKVLNILLQLLLIKKLLLEMN